jgi:hypothetical protein
MSQNGAISLGCLALAFGSALAALRCIADQLLPSATIYTLTALALVAAAVKVAIAAF